MSIASAFPSRDAETTSFTWPAKVDLFGVLRAKLVPARAIKDMQKDGAGFAGFAAWLDMTPVILWPSASWANAGAAAINSVRLIAERTTIVVDII